MRVVLCMYVMLCMALPYVCEYVCMYVSGACTLCYVVLYYVCALCVFARYLCAYVYVCVYVKYVSVLCMCRCGMSVCMYVRNGTLCHVCLRVMYVRMLS